jgi:hypothetical protein
MKFSLYLAAAMMTLLVANPSYAQDIRGTVTGNAIQLQIVGGYKPVTYLWSNGSTQAGLSDLPNGRYCVTVTDALCGTASACFEVEKPCDLYGGFEISTKAQPCQGSSNGRLCGVQRLGRRPPSGTTIATYAWSTGETSNCINVSAGTYSLTATDQRGCVGERTVTIETAEPIVISETVSEACKTEDGFGAIQLIVTPALGRFTYAWSNGATEPNITGLQPDNYSVTITDNNGCTQSKNLIVPKADMTGDVITAKVTNNTECSGRPCAQNAAEADGAIELEVIKARNYNYSWTGESTGLPNAPTITDLCPGYYAVNVSIAGVAACSLSISEPICCCRNQPGTATNPSAACNNTNPPALEVDLEPKSPSSSGSSDGQIQLIATNGSGRNKIKWVLPDNSVVRDQIVLSGLSQAGQYCVTVNDGCSNITKCVTLEFCNTINIAITEVIGKTCDCTVSPDCNAGKIQLTSVTGGITPHKFKWSNGKTTKDVEDLVKGNYTLTVTTASGCSQTKSFAVGAVATTFVLNSSDCRFYDEVCPMNNKVVKLQSKSAPTLGTQINTNTCFREQICLNGQVVPIKALFTESQTTYSRSRDLCRTIEYCKEERPGLPDALFFRSERFYESTVQVIRNYSGCPAGFNLYTTYCGSKVVYTECDRPHEPNGESVVVTKNKIENEVYLFNLLDTLSKNYDNSSYIVPKNVNEKTTVAEFEKLMSDKTLFNDEDLADYRTLKTPKNNTSEKVVNGLKVFPNPFNQSFTIEIDNQGVNKATISVYNALGQVVMSNQYNFTKGKNIVNIDAKQLNESIYVVEMIDEKGVRMTQKIVKTKN